MKKFTWIGSLGLVLFFVLPITAVPVHANSFENVETTVLLEELTTSKLSKTADVINRLSVVGGDDMLQLFETLLEGNLYFQKSDRKLLKVAKLPDGTLSASHVFSGEEIGTVNKRSVKKIRVNNKLRKQLRGIIARIQLNSEDVSLRLAAAKTMLNNVDNNSVLLVTDRLKKELDKNVKQALLEVEALFQLQANSQSDIRIAALAELKNSIEPVVRNEIATLLERDENGNYLETDKKVRTSAHPL